MAGCDRCGLNGPPDGETEPAQRQQEHTWRLKKLHMRNYICHLDKKEKVVVIIGEKVLQKECLKVLR